MDSPSVSRHLVPDLDAGDLLERFLVSAVGAILGIRAYLAATGYPQVGGNGLHVAHMLWGGLLMLVAVVLLLSFLGGRVKVVASVLGGLGFGTFVDELGKFITSDNNYFFEPTVAILYAIFVVLFLTFRSIARQRDLSPDAYLANALETIRDAVLRGEHDAEGVARAKAVALIDRCEPNDALVVALRSALHAQSARSAAPPKPSGPMHAVRRAYLSFVRSTWVRRAVVGVFLLHALGAIVASIVAVVADPGFAFERPDVSFAEAGAGISSFLAGLFAVIGAAQMRFSMLAAYEWFRRSTLVSIFLAQIFAFYREEFLALSSLAVAIVYLAALNYAIKQAKRSRQVHADATPNAQARTAATYWITRKSRVRVTAAAARPRTQSLRRTANGGVTTLSTEHNEQLPMWRRALLLPRWFLAWSGLGPVRAREWPRRDYFSAYDLDARPGRRRHDPAPALIRPSESPEETAVPRRASGPGGVRAPSRPDRMGASTFVTPGVLHPA